MCQWECLFLHVSLGHSRGILLSGLVYYKVVPGEFRLRGERHKHLTEIMYDLLRRATEFEMVDPAAMWCWQRGQGRFFPVLCTNRWLMCHRTSQVAL